VSLYLLKFTFQYFGGCAQYGNFISMQEKVTKQILMERALSEQLRERQEMEKKLQKLVKTMDYLERAKREEAAPLIEAAFQQRLVEEKALHEHEQQVSA
jgi:translation initiation factor 3 subunit A